MRKLLFILAGVILAMGLISCEKQDKNSPDFPGQGAAQADKETITTSMKSTPEIAGAVGPYIIPPANGKDRGGNRTCADAKAAWVTLFPDLDPILVDCDDCGTKMDIDDDYMGEVDGFPFDVWVNSDGSIGFSVPDGVLNCKIQAVIVKGSNQANVYYFPEGTEGADGLSAPAFDPQVPSRFPWVSNLTFCYSCEPEKPSEWVIALKTGLEKEVNSERVTSYAYTPGDHVWNNNSTSIPIGYHWLGFGDDFTLLIKPADGGGAIGTITATEVDNSGVPSIMVVVTITDGGWDIDASTPHLYVGSVDGLELLDHYQDFPFDDDDAVIETGFENVATFMIPEASITW